MTVRIDINEDSCRGCRMCVEICPTAVLAFDEAKAKAKVKTAEDCIACLSCAYLCPSGTIRHADHPVVKNFYRDLDFVRVIERYL